MPISSKLTRRAVFALLVVAGASALSDPCLASERDYLEAVAQYRSGRMSDAYGRFMILAVEGDSDAARIVLYMYKFGPVLYGAHWDAHPHDIADWTQLARNSSGRPEPVFRPEGYVPMGAKPKVKSKSARNNTIQ